MNWVLKFTNWLGDLIGVGYTFKSTIYVITFGLLLGIFFILLNFLLKKILKPKELSDPDFEYVYLRKNGVVKIYISKWAITLSIFMIAFFVFIYGSYVVAIANEEQLVEFDLINFVKYILYGLILWFCGLIFHHIYHVKNIGEREDIDDLLNRRI